MENKTESEHFEAENLEPQKNIEPHQNVTGFCKKGLEALEELQNP